MKKIYTMVGLLALGFSTYAEIGGKYLQKGNNISSAMPFKKASMLTTSALQNDYIYEIGNSNSISAVTVPFFFDSLNHQNNWVITDSLGAGTGWVFKPTNAIPATLTAQGFAATFNSTSAGAYVIVDSDGGGQTATQNSTLRIKNPISCTGHTGVYLEFNEYYRPFQDETSILVSTDSINWTTFDVPTHTSSNTGTSTNPHKITLNITAIAGNQPQVWIAFNYFGAWDWFWAIDDISLKDAPANDLSFQTIFYGNYSRIPLEQTPDSISPYATFSNEGGTAQTNIKLKVSCIAANYSDSSSVINSISPGAIDTLEILNSVAVLDSLTTYTFNFKVNQTELDTTPINNSKSGAVIINNSVYARDNNKYNGQGYGSSTIPFEVGNAFFIRNPTRATSISFACAAGSNPQQVTCKLYKIDVQDSALVYNPVGETSPVDILASSVNSSTNANNPIFLTAEFAIPIDLIASSYYLAVVSGTAQDTLFIAAGSSIEYEDINPKLYGAFGDAGAVGWFSILTPLLVRLNVDKNSTIGLNEVNYTDAISVFPNPTTNSISLNFSKSNTAIAKLVNINGQVVYSENVSNKTNATIDMNALAKGVYTLQIVTEKGVATKKVVKQ